VAERDRPRRDDGAHGDRRRDGKPRSGGRPSQRGKWQARPRHEDRPRREERPRRDERPRGEERPPIEHSHEERPPGSEGRQTEQGQRPEGEPWRGQRPRQQGGPWRKRRPFERPLERRPPGGGLGFRTRRHEPIRPERGDFISEEDELIAGRRPVEEAFAAGRHARRLLVVPERRPALDNLVVHATTLRIPVIEVEGGTLSALAGFDGHQGVALVVEPRSSATLDDVLALARQRAEPLFVLVLDSLEDPQNFGTLLRSAEACGVHGVLFPTRRAAPLSPAAIKAAAGATEHLLLAPLDDLPGALADLHGHGVRVVAAEEGAALDYLEADLRGALAIVVGSEGRGISAPVRRRLDLSVRIPMRGRVASLNAAVAGSVLLFAASAQRPAAPGPLPEPSPESH
jgi:23S rRNA (guanosine2251-2'-O)-methyltransferase